MGTKYPAREALECLEGYIMKSPEAWLRSLHFVLVKGAAERSIN